ncbi:TetR/AcrR family transcriptional regulator [Amorphus orientalis]|uniref:AcrR family transcriptional regulator n=1 Tax=Amorphus orientalis TaxID=649198 RepID=A0AAE3VRW6_9HYPH|nr:TetR/AcrR family transcriptional regulator [Amorphus orientalis]MDQ0317047.1 AcrR family transcriptional regulator [Amorphus orientalis]
MPQVKKQAVADAILAAATDLFRKQGYTQTSMAEIARAANTSTSNLYVYFFSKLDILLAIYEPWLQNSLDRLELELADIADPRARLEHLLLTLWRDMPRANDGFAINFIQALSTSAANERCDPALLRWATKRVAGMLRAALPPERMHAATPDQLASFVMMAFDGFNLNHNLRGVAVSAEMSVNTMVTLLLGQTAPPRAAGSSVSA